MVWLISTTMWIYIYLMSALLFQPASSRGWLRLCEQQQTPCTVGLCETAECGICSKGFAECRTSNGTQPIPQTLPPKTEEMLLYYSGSPVGIFKSMFKRYIDLSNVTLYGNFSFLLPETFSQHRFLHFFTLKHSLVSFLPDNLFHDFSRLVELVLPRNQFTSIPDDIFHLHKKITTLDFSHNPIDICRMTTIGEGFRRLPVLSEVQLAGLGASGNQTCSMDDIFLAPLGHITNLFLDLSESHILHRNGKLLLPLVSMREGNCVSAN